MNRWCGIAMSTKPLPTSATFASTRSRALPVTLRPVSELAELGAFANGTNALYFYGTATRGADTRRPAPAT